MDSASPKGREGPFSSWIPLLAALLWGGGWGCSSLPDYAAPQGRVVDPHSVDRSDTISYRPLKRGDFRAEALPDHVREHAEKLGALTCAYVVTTPDTGYEVQELRDANGRSTFTGRFSKLGFVAEMDRKCSWWNPKLDPAKEAYVLQHEQIHFALAEVEARRQTRKARRLVAEFSVTTSSLDEAKQRIQGEVTKVVERAMKDLISRNEDFDEETSLQYDPQKQQRWFDVVHAELAELD